ncbi:MAG: DUF4115 domain-containing protein [Betaproteobacteria bacterium HGW-Betaproteobacteria-18]|nr:MAG: DUF4115 domain-containing protein [Betaproteobacteria bacterium HGW-Betaproteobacteria-18]
MSESFQVDQSQQVVDLMSSRPSAGALLKAARESQGLHVAALAVMLKVPVRKLEALEADRFEELLDMVFTRALAASVCRVLKIDPVPVLAALPQTETPRFKTDQSGLNTPFKTGRFEWGQQLKNRLTSPLGLGVGLLVLGIFVILIWPDNKAADAGFKEAAGLPETKTSQVITSVMPASTANSAAETSLLAAPQNLSTLVQETAPTSAAISDTAPETLMLQSRGTSWVEVTDAQGVLQLRKTLAPGEQIRLGGILPLSVVLGRANEVDVSVRGQRLDVTAATKDNVARFEVK